MNYTKNYRLPQWVKEDRIMMDDFNAMNSSIESGLTTANTTANTAKAEAAQAKQIAQQTAGAAYTPDNKPYVVGTYVGDSKENWRAINVGFRPSFVIITGMEFTTNPILQPMIRFGIVGQSTHSFARITDTGFEFRRVAEEPYPEVNYNLVNYTYIAFQ